MHTRKIATCSCGQLRVTCNGEPVRISICHCPACQRRTGSIFGVQARFPSSVVSVDGHDRTWTRNCDDGDEVKFHFCPNCASTLFWELKSLPDLVMVAVGNFGDPTFPQPRVSVWEATKHEWLTLPAEIEHIA